MTNQLHIQSNEEDYHKYINEAVNFTMPNLANDITIISGENEEIRTSKFLLSVFSPYLVSFFSSSCCTVPTLFLPDFSTSSIKHLIHIINHGSTDGTKCDRNEVVAAAKLLLNITIGNELIEENEDPNYCEFLNEGQGMEITGIKSSNIKKALPPKKFKGQKITLHSCTQCPQKFKTPHSMKRHVQSIHENEAYQCQMCEFKSGRKDMLNIHVVKKHEEVCIPCDQCDYKTTVKHNLRVHKEYVHEGGRFSCNYCDYKVSMKKRIAQHVETSHEEFLFFCDQCNYKVELKSYLQKHLESEHGKKIKTKSQLGKINSVKV